MRMSRRLLVIVIIGILVVMVLPTGAQNRAQVIQMPSNLRLRSAPTTDSETIEFLTSGTTLLILQQSTDGTWYEVQVEGTTQQGWVAADFVQTLGEGDVPVSSTTFSDTVVNGIPILTGVNQNAVDIFKRGQAIGNRATVFTKIGDSITYTDWFLDTIGDGVYELGSYWYLQNVVDYFGVTPARDENSFKHNSVAAQSGWSAHLMQDPDYASALCQVNETPLECEYRITRPSIALIMLGTNDVGFVDSYAFRINMEWVVQTTIDHGIIPVISTIPNRLDKQERIPEFNGIIREIAQKYQIPLWDYHAILSTLPNEGLSTDGVHPSSSPRGYVGQADFTESNLQFGFPMRNMTALQVLHSIWQQVILRG